MSNVSSSRGIGGPTIGLFGRYFSSNSPSTDPSNTEWQRDLSVTRQGIGDTQLALGNRIGALENYRAQMETAKRLAAIDPRNTEWQLDVVICLWKLGTVNAPTQRRSDRVALLSAGRQLAESLQHQGRLVGPQMQWRDNFDRALKEL